MARSKERAPAVFELRSASMTLVVVALKTTDMAAIEAEMTARFSDTPDMFNHDPVVIDIAQAEGDPMALDYGRLVSLLRRFNMVAAAVRGGSPEQMSAAAEAGLGEAPEAVVPAARPVVQAPAAVEAPPVAVEAVTASPIEVSPIPAAPAVPQLAPAHVATMIVDKPLRSGQQIYARGGDLVVLAVVNFGAEVIADGSIHVYAPLRGKAIAGARGNTDALIFFTSLRPPRSTLSPY